ncbi:MAG: hypothetical protein BGO01_08060 [Armatimonadetes bacterium 55-13]|nr:PD-(D/E)XK nuclease family protein [Armatimonadota bacterium]OJU62428.1 MAG: hypothetical protein BGO01_08060 [Armatimonadetes bacterium 55-13]
MPRRPTLSPTKITTYLACPVKFRFTYKDSRGKWYMRAKSYYSFGTTLHRVLERFHDEGDIGVQTTDQAVAAMEESWIDAGFSSAEEMQEAFSEGKTILERYVNAAKDRPSNVHTLMVERMIKMPFPEFDLVGRVDRVDEHEDGTLEIVDYKSGRELVSEEDVRTDLAMCAYQLMLHHLYPDRGIRATIIALRSGAEASYSLTQDERSEFAHDLEQLGLQILRTEYDQLTPKPKELCRGCDFLPLCRTYPDFELLTTA